MADKRAPDISVVIPCYNAERWVGRAIDSVLAQEGVSVEVIVIDDGSTDCGVEVLRRYGERIHWETGPNRGACVARNRGLALARAKYVMFLDADDYIEGPFLASAINALVSSQSKIAFGIIETELGDKRLSFSLPECVHSVDIMRAFLQKGFIPPCGTVWLTSFIRSIGGWKNNIRRHQDYELTFRALSSDPHVSLFYEGRGIYFQHLSKSRISFQFDIDTVKDQAFVIRFVGDCLNNVGISDVENFALMKRRAYRLWQQTCRSGDPEAIKIGRALYREFGGTGHIGSISHKIVASLFGLQAKERVAYYLARTRRRRERLKDR